MRFLPKVTFGAILAMGMVSASQAHVREIFPYLSISGAFTYTQSSNNGLSVGDLLVATSSNNFDGERRAVFLDPDYEGGFNLGLSYHIPHSRTRLYVNYDHFKDDQENDTDGIRNLGFAPGITFSPIGGTRTVTATEGYARAEHRSREFQIGFGHNVPFSQGFYLDLLGYFEYDNVHRTIGESISIATTAGINQVLGQANPDAIRYTENRVNGWGPGIGAIAHMVPYSRYANMGIFVGVKTALLRVDNDFFQEYLNAPQGTFYTYDPEESHSIIGKLDISFGVDYSCGVRTHAVGPLYFDASLGMRYMNMFNVFKNGNAEFNPIISGAILPLFAANTGYPNDWGRVGPFLQFSIGGPSA
jgi:hypothetical protein